MQKNGFVLVHGAGLGSWVWDRVKTGLNGPVLAVDLPGRGDTSKKFSQTTLEDYVQSVVTEIKSFQAEKLVLVGHSFAGEIILRIATLMPERITGLVFVSAVIPPTGKSMLSLRPWLQRAITRIMMRLASTRPPEAVIRAASCSDLDQNTCADLLKRYSPESPHIYFDPVEWKLPGTMQRTYVKTLRDKSVIPPLQERMLVRVQPVRVVTIDSGHIPMLSKPKELTEILNACL